MTDNKATSMTVAELIKSKNAIFFDLFHTLTYLEIKNEKGVLTCERLGVDRVAWNEQLWNNSYDRLIGKKTDPLQIITELTHNIDPSIPMERIKNALENRIYQFKQSILNIPESTLDVLQTLKNAGKKLVLISNADVMEKSGWDGSPISKIFDHAIFSCDVGYAKPDHEIFELAMNRIGVKAGESVFIGDGGSDELRAAREVGMNSVMITGIISKLWPDKVEERKKDADFIIKDISELIE